LTQHIATLTTDLIAIVASYTAAVAVTVSAYQQPSQLSSSSRSLIDQSSDSPWLSPTAITSGKL
jgi:hypothetical protein